jgi:hypothetical protein
MQSRRPRFVPARKRGVRMGAAVFAVASMVVTVTGNAGEAPTRIQSLAAARPSEEQSRMWMTVGSHRFAADGLAEALGPGNPRVGFSGADLRHEVAK